MQSIHSPNPLGPLDRTFDFLAPYPHCAITMVELLCMLPEKAGISGTVKPDSGYVTVTVTWSPGSLHAAVAQLDPVGGAPHVVLTVSWVGSTPMKEMLFT